MGGGAEAVLKQVGQHSAVLVVRIPKRAVCLQIQVHEETFVVLDGKDAQIAFQSLINSFHTPYVDLCLFIFYVVNI